MMRDLIACPVCGTTAEPAAQVGAILICANPKCGASLVDMADGTIPRLVRRATATDTTALSDEDLQTLRKARGRTR